MDFRFPIFGFRFSPADFVRLGGREEFPRDQPLELPGDPVGGFGELRREVVAQLFAQEHSVRADVNDPFLRQQAGDEILDVRVDQRLAPADRNHRRPALRRGTQAVFQRHDLLQRGRILADAPAAGAGEVAGVERLQLQDRRKFLNAPDFFSDDMARNPGGQRERKPHRARIRGTVPDGVKAHPSGNTPWGEAGAEISRCSSARAARP